jgi:hypothetical protein
MAPQQKSLKQMDRVQNWMILFKFSQREHLQQLRSRGLLHMKHQEDFRTIESKPRRDRFETTDRVVQPNALKRLMVRSNHSQREVVIGPDQLAGPLLISLGTLSCNVYCMFALTQQNITCPLVDPDNFEFGDAFVVILRTRTFLDRVLAAATSRRLQCEWRLVEYYDPKTYSGETGPFRKPASLVYQKEFRFIVQPGSSSPINLEIGSLADITSEVLPLSEINRLIDLC